MRTDIFDYEIVKNPEIFQQNRLPAHSDHRFFRETDGDCIFCLNGQWNFKYAENYAGSPAGFEADDYDCRGWDTIPVPAHIQLQGYDTPAYINTQYPWDGLEQILPGEIPVRYNPVASYVKYFEVPEYLKGLPLYISFRGVESGFALWLNGRYIGYSEDSFTPSDFDLSGAVRDGENKLAVQVFKWTGGSWCEDQDFFRFSGIFRDVLLYVKPEVHVEDLRIRTLLDDEYKEAVLALKPEVSGSGSVTAVLTDAAGNEIFRKDLHPGKEALLEILSPRLWSAEDPYLYDLKLEMRDDAGRMAETVTEKVGFRRFEIRDAIMYLNGKRIVFRGVNRHEFCCESGRVINEDIIRTDLVTMKRNNINAIRTCHYPNRTALYRLCDEYGLYVIDETNLETHGIWDAIIRDKEPLEFSVPGNRPEYLPMILDRANSMYQRDKNHACILIWSCGNESFGGEDLQKMADQFRALDPDRPVHYEGVYHDRRYPVSDIESTMYVPAEETEKYLKDHRDKPYIHCEYAHAMGNSCGALEKYTDLTEKEPLYQGGFIWDYIDQCLKKTDRQGRTYMAYGGDSLERPHDGNFSGNGIVYGDDRTPSPKMQEVKYCYQNIKAAFEDVDGRPLGSRSGICSGFGPGDVKGIRICIRNLFLFHATSAYACTLTLEREGELLCSLPLDTAVPPLEKRKYPLPEQMAEALAKALDEENGKDGLSGGQYGRELLLTVSFTLKEDALWAKAGHETAFGQLAFRCGKAGKAVPVKRDPAMDSTAFSGEFEVIRGWSNFGVRGRNFEMLYSELMGGLVSWKVNGRELLMSPAKPNFWRAMTDNDIANLLPQRAGVWKAGSMFVGHKYLHGRRYEPCLVEEVIVPAGGSGQSGETGHAGNGETCLKITQTYFPAIPETAGESIRCEISLLIHPDGSIDVEQSMPVSSRLGEIPEFSVLWPLNPELDRVTWYGPGPEETYRDRTHGKTGIWSGSVKEQMARYLRPQECGWKENARWAKVTDENGSGLLFEMEPDTGLGFSALPYSPHQLETADHPNELPDSCRTWVRVGTQMGVGGDDTWGALVHPEYLLDNSRELRIRFRVTGI